METLKHALPSGAMLTAYLHGSSPEMPWPVCKARPAVIICPGGAYRFTSAREQDPPAAVFLNMGLQVFVLEYSVGEKAGGKLLLEELARSVLYVRRHSAQWQIDPDKLLLLGFSAGGHLAASLGVHWDDPEILARCGLENGKAIRPDGLILAYPVITTGEYAHRESCNTVTAGSTEPMEYWSLETQVTDKVPPVFIWQTAQDKSVPVQNSYLFVGALLRAGVPCEYHMFARGQHGISVCTSEVGTPSASVKQWIPLCRMWIEEQFGELGGM